MICAKPPMISAKLPHRESTGKLLANMQRSTPNKSIVVKTISRFSIADQGLPGCPITHRKYTTRGS